MSFQSREGGFIKKAPYKYDKFGLIDWKSMVPDEYKYPNSDWFYKNNEETPENAKGLTEEQTIISLAGLKWIAKIRGYFSVDNELVSSSPESAVCRCTIAWVPNSEDPKGVVYTEIASATKENTTGFFGPKFLESIAANRAFCRTVRNFLGINSVSDQEIDPADFLKSSKEEKPKTKVKPQNSLKNLSEKMGYSDLESLRKDFKDLEYFHKKMDQWVEYDNIPAKECMIIISKLKNAKGS